MIIFRITILATIETILTSIGAGFSIPTIKFPNIYLAIYFNIYCNVNRWNYIEIQFKIGNSYVFFIVNGNLTGDINKDAITPDENIVINEDATVRGEINYNTDRYNITLIFPNFKNGFTTERNIYSKEKIFTPKEFFMEHFVFEDGYILEYYTDSKHTTKWDYSVSKSMEVYGKWIEHEHVYDGSVILYENAIRQQCLCGYLGESLTLEEPKGLVENENEQAIIVNNKIGVEPSDYSIVYKIKNDDGSWQDVKGIPIKKFFHYGSKKNKENCLFKNYKL